MRAARVCARRCQDAQPSTVRDTSVRHAYIHTLAFIHTMPCVRKRHRAGLAWEVQPCCRRQTTTTTRAAGSRFRDDTNHYTTHTHPPLPIAVTSGSGKKKKKKKERRHPRSRRVTRTAGALKTGSRFRDDTDALHTCRLPSQERQGSSHTGWNGIPSFLCWLPTHTSRSPNKPSRACWGTYQQRCQQGFPAGRGEGDRARAAPRVKRPAA